MKKNLTIKRILAFILSVSLVLGDIPVLPTVIQARAQEPEYAVSADEAAEEASGEETVSDDSLPSGEAAGQENASGDSSPADETAGEEDVTEDDIPEEAVGVQPDVTSGYCGDPDVNEGQDVSWYLTESGSDPGKYILTIDGSGDMADYTEGDAASPAPWYGVREDIIDVEIADGITAIGENAFTGTAFESITIPGTVTEIGAGAFGESSLTSIIFRGTEEQWNDVAKGSYSIPEACTVSHKISGSCGKNADYTCDFNTKTLTISGSGAIADSAFKGKDLSGIERILIGKDITEIGGYAFSDVSSGQTSAVSVSFESGSKLTKIGDSAFYEYDRLKEITIPESVTYIAQRAFYGCDKLESVNIPEGITSIEEETFVFCVRLESIEFPTGITKIGKRAFFACGYLTEVSIPESVTTIGDDAFSGCFGVKDVYCYADIESISWDLSTEYGSAFGTDNPGNVQAVIHVSKGTDIDYLTDTKYSDWVTNGGSFKDDLGAVSYTVTFKVVNGSWDDGTTEDKTVTLNGYEGDELKLTAADIPAAGSEPDEGYKAGKWDTKPNTAEVIEYNRTFIYRYALELTNVSYLEGSWENGKCVFREKSVDSPVLLDSSTTQLTDGNTYVADGKLTINSRITVSGNVKLILADGCDYKVQGGIAVEEGNTLSIFGQKEGSGQLKTSGGEIDEVCYAPGIGGSAWREGDAYRYARPGTLNIHGGKIIAQGVGDGAGIGGAGSMETLSDGSVLSGGTVNIYGGSINASGAGGAAGIGGGNCECGNGGNGGTVNIYGGIVIANGNINYGGAGIGGAYNSQSGGSVTILGGKVTTNGGYARAGGGEESSGIGAYTLDGEHGTLTLGEGVSLKGSEDGSSWQEMQSPYTTRYRYMTAEGPEPVVVEPVSYTVTFKVVNGSWNDGTTEDKTVSFNGTTLDTFCLSADDIPAVGTKPVDGYKAGKWEVTPGAGTTVTKDVTYKYIYRAKSDSEVFEWLGANGSARVDTGFGNRTGTEGCWYVDTDGKDGGNSTVSWDQAEADENGSVINGNISEYGCLSGTAVLDKGDLTYNPYVYICFDIVGRDTNNELIAGDVSAWGGLSISYECDCDAYLVLGLTDDLEPKIEYANPQFKLAKTSAGTVEHIPWTEIKQPSWYGGSTKISGEEAAEKLTRVMFRIQAPAGEYHFRIYGIGSVDADFEYTISYELNGGTNAESNPATFKIDTESFTLADPVRDGYEFAGWYEDEGFNTPAAATIEKGTHANKKFYARWKKLLTNSDITVEAIPEQPYTGSAIEPAVVVKDGENDITDQCTITFSDNTETGTATVTITAKAESAGYAGQTTTTFKIGKPAATVTTAPTANTLTYNGSEQALVTAGVANGGTMVYSLSANGAYSETIPSKKDAGTYTVYYKASADGSHIDSASASVDVTIARKAVTVTADNKSKTYGTADPAFTATVNGTVGSDTVTYTINRAEGDAAGTYAITVTGSATQGNYSVSFVNGTFTINKAAASVSSTPSANVLTYNGSEQALVTAGTANGGTMVYSLSANGAYSETIPSKKDAGTYTVYYKVSADGNHTDSAAASVDVTIARRAATVTADNKSKTYGTTDPAFTATVSGTVGTDTLNYSISRTEGDAVGTYVINVTGAAEQGNYSVSFVNGTFTIGRAVATVSITPSANVLTYNGSEQELVTAGVADGGTMVYSISTSGTYSEVIPAKKDAGTYTVYYMVVGDDNHEDSAVEYMEINIAKAPVTVSADNISKIYGEEDPGLTVTIEGDPTVTAEVQYSIYRIAGEDAGSYEIIVEEPGVAPDMASPNGNLDVTFVNGTFTINKAAASVSSTPSANVLTYNGSEQALVTAGTANGGTMVYSLSANGAYSETIPSKKDAGTYTVYYKVSADGNHTDSAAASVDVTIARKAATVTADNKSKTYGTTDPAFTATVSGTVGTDTLTYSISRTEGDTVGTYVITVTGAAEQGNYSVSFVNGTFIINKAAASVATAPAAKTLSYNGSEQALVTAGTANGGTMVYSLSSNGTYTETIPSKKDAGTYTVYYKVTGDSNHSDSAVASVDVTIARKAATVTADNKSKTYGAADPALTVTVSGNVGTDTLTYTISRAEGDAVGTYTITVTGAAVQGNYSVSYVNGTFTINKAASSVTTAPTAKTLTYNGSDQALVNAGTANGGTMVYSLSANGAYSETIPSKKDAGTYTVYYKVSGDGNHTDSAAASIDVTIARKAATVTADNKSKTYGAADPALTVTVSGTVGTDTLTYTISRAEGDAVGTYVITVTGAAEQGNYSVSFVNGTFTIGKAAAAVSITPSANVLTYNGSEQALVTAGTANGGTMVYSLSANGTYNAAIPSKKDAGTYTVYYKVSADGNHTDSAAASVDVTIARKAATVTADNKSKTYGGTDPALTATVSGNLGSDTLAYTVSRAEGDAVGTYTITVTGAAVQGNYSVSFVNGTFTINKAALSVSANANTITYGDAPAAAGVSYNGFVNGDGAAALSGSLAYDYSYVRYGNVGDTYTITPKGLTSDNYEITYIPGRLSVLKKEVGISWGETALIYDGTEKVPAATVTGLVNNDEVSATVSGGQIEVGRYTATVTALTGDKAANYVLPADTTVSFTISRENSAEYTLPSAKEGLVYDGTGQELVTAGTVSGCTVVYAIGSDAQNAPEEGWNSAVPTAVHAGGYHVWYKITGDEHGDVLAMDCITLTIGRRALSVSANAQTVDYGRAISAGLADVTVEGLVAGDVLTSVTLTQSTEDATDNGSISVSGVVIRNGETDVTADYDISITAGKLIINRIRWESPKAPEVDSVSADRVVLKAVEGAEYRCGEGTWQDSNIFEGLEPLTSYSFYIRMKEDANHLVSDISPASVVVTEAKASPVAGEDSTELVFLFENGTESFSTTYTGVAIRPEVLVYDGNKLLKEETDYRLTYTNNVNAGTAKVNVAGTGAYKQTHKMEFTILPKAIADEKGAPAKDIVVSGLNVKGTSKPNPALYYNGVNVPSSQYGVETVDDTVSIYAKGSNFTGRIEGLKVVRIADAKVYKQSQIKVKYSNAGHSYNGKPQLLSAKELEVTDANKNVLTEGTDYVVNYSGDTVNTGTVKFTVIGIGKYTGAVKKSYKIEPAKNAVINVELIPEAGMAAGCYSYVKTGATPGVIVTADINGSIFRLTEGTDYTLRYSNNKTAGVKGSIKVSLKGNYRGVKAKSAEFNTVKASFTEAVVYAGDKIYKKPGKYQSKPVVTINGQIVAAGEYSISYESDGAVNGKITLGADESERTVRITVTSKGKNYASGQSVTGSYRVFRGDTSESVTVKDMSKAKVYTMVKGGTATKKNMIYTGRPVTFDPDDEERQADIRVKAGAAVLMGAEVFRYFDVSYADNIKTGKATVILTAKEKLDDGSANPYSGMCSGTFNIKSRSIK